MELKLDRGMETESTITGFNRTFMELKLYRRMKFESTISRFNRTFMELKSSFCDCISSRKYMV